MLSDTKKIKLFEIVTGDGAFTILKHFLNGARVSWSASGESFTVDIEILRMDSGYVFYIDPLPLTCNVNLYPQLTKNAFAELTRRLAIINSKLLKD